MFKAIYQCDKCKSRLFDLLTDSGEIEIKCGKCKKHVRITVEELTLMVECHHRNENHTPDTSV